MDLKNCQCKINYYLYITGPHISPLMVSRANYPPFYICQIFNRNIPLPKIFYAFSIDNDDVYFANIALLKNTTICAKHPHSEAPAFPTLRNIQHITKL